MVGEMEPTLEMGLVIPMPLMSMCMDIPLLTLLSIDSEMTNQLSNKEDFSLQQNPTTKSTYVPEI